MAILAQQFGLPIDPDSKVEDISVGQQQRVEILKALYRRADILILDEPTAVLRRRRSSELFIGELSSAGACRSSSSRHKLNEVLEIADRITVLRRGRAIETVPREGGPRELARMMVGRGPLRVDQPPATPGEVVLELDDVHVRDDRG